jgi:hypothetical protein
MQMTSKELYKLKSQLESYGYEFPKLSYNKAASMLYYKVVKTPTNDILQNVLLNDMCKILETEEKKRLRSERINNIIE